MNVEFCRIHLPKNLHLKCLKGMYRVMGLAAESLNGFSRNAALLRFN